MDDGNVCGAGMFFCNFDNEVTDVDCIPDAQVCDGTINCPNDNNADEKYCSKYKIIQGRTLLIYFQ